MRDRRNTSLSTSSFSSSTSTLCGRDSIGEKDVESPILSSRPHTPLIKENRRRYSYRHLLALVAFLAVGSLVTLWICLDGRGFALRSRYAINEHIHDTSYRQSTEPSAVLVTDHVGNHKWTVHIPYNTSFPLPARQYTDICRHGDVLKTQLKYGSRFGRLGQPSYDSKDWTFVDPANLERHVASAPDVCSKSLTFVMDTKDAGFGKTLLLLWLSYGLAKKEGRAFFIDDTRWPYGRYSTYFVSPPSPRCSPPPAHLIVPCPHQARHLLVSAATAPWAFGTLFERQYTGRRVYDLIHKGYKDLFKLTGEDGEYAAERINHLQTEAKKGHSAVIGMHIRRGDLHPHEYQYSHDYLPLDRYASSALTLFHSLLNPHAKSTTANADLHQDKYTHSPVLLASDDPDILHSPHLIQAVSPWKTSRAQERIQLATKSALDQLSPARSIRPPGSAYVKHVEENSGWEGGFYSALFYAIGKPAKSRGPPPPSGGRVTELAAADLPVSHEAMHFREFIGRAYLLDLAVLGQASRGVVCAVSSATCRVLGVMMGWEAVSGGRWVNVEDAVGWKWVGEW